MIHLPRVLAAADEVQRFCHQRDWRFCFIGGIAVQRWGEPRFTQDVDLNQIRSELKPLLELKGEMDALAKLETKIATVERRLRTKP